MAKRLCKSFANEFVDGFQTGCLLNNSYCMLRKQCLSISIVK